MTSKDERSSEGHNAPATDAMTSEGSRNGPCHNQQQKCHAFMKLIIKLPKLEGKCEELKADTFMIVPT
jgi:hypothetical protein